MFANGISKLDLIAQSRTVSSSENSREAVAIRKVGGDDSVQADDRCGRRAHKSNAVSEPELGNSVDVDVVLSMSGTRRMVGHLPTADTIHSPEIP